ncbi:MAG TPA: hypothetical protein VJ323_13160 [Bryobacteraceae bacterium]|nr:hypothetical protein [Bryobacteraceae bacterium]
MSGSPKGYRAAASRQHGGHLGRNSFNRIDKIVVFMALGEPELRRILDLELAHVQQRVLHSPVEKQFVFNLSHAAKDFLLAEATNVKYGARHLKRAIQRFLVQPLSNLISQ